MHELHNNPFISFSPDSRAPEMKGCRHAAPISSILCGGGGDMRNNRNFVKKRLMKGDYYGHFEKIS